MVNISFASEENEPEDRVKTRGKGRKWSLLKIFATDAEVRNYIKREKIWAIQNKHETDEGVKIHYRCNLATKKGPQCMCKMYVLQPHTSIESKIYLSGGHTHENARKTEMDDAVQIIVLSLAKKGMKPAAIKKYIEEELPEAKVPNLKCIYNYLHRTNYKKNAEHKVSVGEMVEWFEANSSIPENESTPFILSHECSEPGDKAKFFRFAVTSKILLKNATKSKILHADATYKLIWQGFPVLIIGCTDKRKTFHPIVIGVSTNETQSDFTFMMESVKNGVKKHFNVEYMPNVMVGDAAPAISNAFQSVFPGGKNTIVTCFAHVIANMKKQKLEDKSLDNWRKIKNDITHLQLAPSKAVFEKAQQCFIDMYQEKEPNFCNYVQRTWFNKNSNWYEGVKHFTPSTNNALEAFNAILKRDHTHRKRVTCAAFKNLLMDIIQTLSEKYVRGEKIVHTSVEPSLDDWRQALDWVKLDRHVMVIDSNKSKFDKIYVESSRFGENFNGNKFTKLHIENYTNNIWENFDQYKKVVFSIHELMFSNDFWNKSVCSCPSFYKNYMCKHILGIAMMKKIVKPPKTANTDVIGQKTKRGRKPNATKALLTD